LKARILTGSGNGAGRESKAKDMKKNKESQQGERGKSRDWVGRSKKSTPCGTGRE